MKIFLIVALCLGVVGCATASNLNNISLGMTKDDVIKVLGNPDSISAKDSLEYLKYNYEPFIRASNLSHSDYDYFVRLDDGKVESFGRVGDFDSAKNPTLDINAKIKNE